MTYAQTPLLNLIVTPIKLANLYNCPVPFTYTYDIVWAGIDIAVLCIGGPVAINLIVFLYFFDIANVLFDIWRLNKTSQSIEKKLADESISSDYAAGIRDYIQQSKKEKYFSYISLEQNL